MKTEAYVDKSLDDFIKENRSMFQRGRGGGASRGTAAKRGGRGGARGQMRSAGLGRASSRGTARGRASPRGSSRGRASLRASARGRANSRGAAAGRGSSRGSGRGRGRDTSRGAGARATSAAQRGSFGQRRRESSARTGGNLSGASRPALISPLKRKQVATKAARSTRLAGRLGVASTGVKAAASMALKKKRLALQQLTAASKQLARVDARNQIMMRRRGLVSDQLAPPRAARRGAAAAAAAAGRAPAPTRRGRPAPPAQPERVQVFHEPAAAVRGRRALNRSRLTADLAPPATSSLLTVQFKNELAGQRRQRPPPPMPMALDLDMDEVMSSPPPPPPPPTPPAPPARNRAGLDPRIQQEIAAIQQRGRAQHHLLHTNLNSSLTGFRPTANVSTRTLNDRFTSDRVIYS